MRDGGQCVSDAIHYVVMTLTGVLTRKETHNTVNLLWLNGICLCSDIIHCEAA